MQRREGAAGKGGEKGGGREQCWWRCWREKPEKSQEVESVVMDGGCRELGWEWLYWIRSVFVDDLGV